MPVSYERAAFSIVISMSSFGLKIMVAAFVQPLPALRNVGQHVTSASMAKAASQLPTMATSALLLRNCQSTTSTTAIGMTASRSIMDPAIQAAAMSFFTGVRIPATLIAGTSFAALFTMTDKGRDTSGLSTTEILLLRLYHVLSLLSLCFSITTVVMSTSAGTMLMLEKYQASGSHVDVYRFLRECMDLEFSLTRFSFLTSVMCFLSAVTGRIIIEFNLVSFMRSQLESNMLNKRYGFFLNIPPVLDLAHYPVDTKTSTCWIHGSQQNDCYINVAVKLCQYKCSVLGKPIFHGCSCSEGKLSFITVPTFCSVDTTARISHIDYNVNTSWSFSSTAPVETCGG